MRAKVPPLKTEGAFCVLCNKPRLEICKHITKKEQFKSLSAKRIHSIRPQNINCTCKKVVYLLVVKPIINNTEEVLRNFGVDLTNTGVHIGKH